MRARAGKRIMGRIDLRAFLRTKFGRDEWSRYIQRGLDAVKTAAVCLTRKAAAPSPDSLGIAVEWLTVKQAAAQLGGVSGQLIYKLFHRGELEGAKIAGAVRIRAASVAAYLDAHSNRKDSAEAPLEETDPAPAPTRRRRRSVPAGFRFVRPPLP